MRLADSVSSTGGVRDQGPADGGFRPDIEGLRAVAVVAVVLFHAEAPGFGGGFVGVDVFFVISGFLITGLLWREVKASNTISLSRFFGARARRLLPAATAVGVVIMICSAVLLPLGQARIVFTDGIASALYVSNYWFILQDASYFNVARHLPPSPFQHYWSLGLEEQFYLVWPMLIIATAWIVRRARQRRKSDDPVSRRPYLFVLALIATGSFALSFLATDVVPAMAFYSLPTRAWQLAVGGLVALTAGHWRRLIPPAAAVAGFAGLGMILLACTQFHAATTYPGSAALLPTIGTALVIGAGCAAPTQGCGRLLGLSPMRAVGRISYSWYLWHWPVLIFAPLVFGHPLGLTARLAAAFLSGGLAILTLRFIENPVRFAAPIRNSAWRSLVLGVAASAAVVCVAVALLVKLPIPVGRGIDAVPMNFSSPAVPTNSPAETYDMAVRQTFAQVQAAVAESADIKAVPSNLTPALDRIEDERAKYSFNGCARTLFEAGQPECAIGDTNSPTTVAVIGDSHAAMFFPAFQELASQRNWRVETMAKAGCPSVDVPINNRISRLLEHHFQHCQQWRTEILDRLQTQRPQLVVVSVWRQYGAGAASNWQPGFKTYDSAWLNSLTRLVRQLRDTGAKVLVLGPTPDPRSVVGVCLSGHIDDATACSPPRSAAVNQAGIDAEAAATAAAGGQYADLTDLFCTAARCPVIVGNTLVYFDWSHLTLQYSRLLAPAIGALADRALARD